MHLQTPLTYMHRPKLKTIHPSAGKLGNEILNTDTYFQGCKRLLCPPFSLEKIKVEWTWLDSSGDKGRVIKCFEGWPNFTQEGVIKRKNIIMLSKLFKSKLSFSSWQSSLVFETKDPWLKSWWIHLTHSTSLALSERRKSMDLFPLEWI